MGLLPREIESLLSSALEAETFGDAAPIDGARAATAPSYTKRQPDASFPRRARRQSLPAVAQPACTPQRIPPTRRKPGDCTGACPYPLRAARRDLPRSRSTDAPAAAQPRTGTPNDGPGVSAAERVVQISLGIAHFQTIAAIGRLYVEYVTLRDAHDPAHGRRHVLMHSVRKLNHDDRPLARRANQLSSNCPRSSTKLSKHNLHAKNLSNRPGAVHQVRGLEDQKPRLTRGSFSGYVGTARFNSQPANGPLGSRTILSVTRITRPAFLRQLGPTAQAAARHLSGCATSGHSAGNERAGALLPPQTSWPTHARPTLLGKVGA